MSDDLERATILVVDDTPDNLTLVNNLLKDRYRVRVAINGSKALKIAFSESPPDLVLLDVMMPGMDGFEVCRQLREHPATQSIPIIFLTAKSEMEDERKGLILGASDYITKPISPPILEARVRIHLLSKMHADFMADKTAYLESEVARRTRELSAIQDVTIQALASLAETRDSDTGNHIRRTQFYVRALTQNLKNHPRFSAYLTEQTMHSLFRSAPLHDIGKVGIPDRILLKPGRLDADEFTIMKTHAQLGRDALQAAENSLQLKVEFLAIAKEISYSHHEKWDGSGYPQQLSNDAIPISGRLMALADVYDALICRRVYKNAMPHEQAVAIILEGKGRHFDPDIVDAFIAIQTEFQDIAHKYADSDADIENKAIQLRMFAHPGSDA